MHYNISYEICALAFLIVVCIDFLGKRRLPTKSNKFFEVFILIGILDIALDLITAYTIEHTQTVPVCLNFILNTVFFHVPPQTFEPGLPSVPSFPDQHR